RIGVDVHDCRIGCATVRDPGFGSIENVLVAALHSLGLQRRSVGTGLRLGKRKTADFFSARERNEKPFLFFVGAVAVKGIAVKRVLSRENDGSGSTASRNFFDDDRVGNVIEAGAAFGFGERHAGEAELGGFGEKIARKAAGFV